MKFAAIKRFFLGVILAFAMLDPSSPITFAQSAKGQIVAGPLFALHNPLGYGGQIEARLSDRFSVGAVGRYWRFSQSYNPGTYEWSGTSIQAVASYHVFRDYHVDPYGALLIGWSRSTDSFDYQFSSWPVESSAYDGLAFSLAAGVRYFLTDVLAVNINVEKFITKDRNFANGLGANVGLERAFR